MSKMIDSPVRYMSKVSSVSTEVLVAKKILFVAGTLAQGGAEKQLYYLAGALKSVGAEVKVVSLTTGDYWQRELQKIGVEVLCVSAGGRFHRLYSIYQLYRRHRPDVVFSMHFFANFYASFPARLLSIRSVGSVRNNGYHSVERLGKLMGSLCFFTPNLIVANSLHGANNIQKIFHVKKDVKLLSNAIDIHEFDIRERAANEAPALILIARLIPSKQVHLFISLLAALIKQGHLCKGIIVGDGPERNRLTQMASEQLAEGVVVFAGQQHDVRPWLQQADMLISTSSHEGTSNVLLEAMAMQLPAVALRFEGVDHLLTHGENGFVAGSLDELKSYCIKLMDDRELMLRMGRNARHKIVEQYSTNRLLANFLKIIQTKTS